MTNAEKIKALRADIAAAEAEIARLERAPGLPPGWSQDGIWFTDGNCEVSVDCTLRTIEVLPSDRASRFAEIYADDLRAFLATVPEGSDHHLCTYPRKGRTYALCYVRVGGEHDLPTITVVDTYGDAASVPLSVLIAALGTLP